MFEIGLKKFLWLKKLKALYRGHVIGDLKSVEIFGTICKKEFQKNKSKKVYSWKSNK